MDSAYNRLIELGIRPSIQRVAIMKYLLTHHTHPTVEDVFLALKKQLPTVSRTTVYNTLRMLCKRCEKVYDFEAMEMPKYTGKIGEGFRIDDTQLYYKGLCPKCLAAMKVVEKVS